ncbi:hypothetical protein ACWEWK_14595 [Streptomyces sp. NPDC003757]
MARRQDGATADVRVGDSRVRAGDAVLLVRAAACRDPEVYPDPGRFDENPGRRHASDARRDG